MKHHTIHRSLPLIVLSALACIPAGTTLAATHQAAHPSKSKVKTVTYKGREVDMRWGPVQAVIKVKGKKITSVKVGVSPETFRSQIIDTQAAPLLQQEVLQAQNAGIDEVSGATMTSDAFISSLQSALKKAHLPTS